MCGYIGRGTGDDTLDHVLSVREWVNVQHLEVTVHCAACTYGTVILDVESLILMDVGRVFDDVYTV